MLTLLQVLFCRASSVIAAVSICAITCSTALAQRHGESLEARATLDRLVDFMGGAKTVYGLRTLVVASEGTQDHDGKEILVPIRTYYAFPLHVRQEITLNGRTLAMASSPDGGVLFTPEGSSQLDYAVRVGVEKAMMRNPVALLKSRLGRGFGAERIGTEQVDGKSAELVRMVLQDNQTTVVVDSSSGQLLEIRYKIASKDNVNRDMIVRYSDWRRLPSGLNYPFAARGEEDGRRVFEVAIRSVEVDTVLEITLFSDGSGNAGHGMRRMQ